MIIIQGLYYKSFLLALKISYSHVSLNQHSIFLILQFFAHSQFIFNWTILQTIFYEERAEN